MTLNKLTKLANDHLSDKGLINPYNGDELGHGYTVLYDNLFHKYIDQDINFLEMGLKIGGPEFGNMDLNRGSSPSIEMWLKYFSNAHIVGFDISDFSFQQNDRFTFIKGDSGIDEDITKLAELKSEYSIILDDASHLSYHQQNALKLLWHKVAPGGYYIIEDLHWQPYQDIWSHFPETPTTYSLFESFFYHNQYINSPLISEDFLNEIKENSSSCILCQSSLSDGKVLIIQKRDF